MNDEEEANDCCYFLVGPTISTYERIAVPKHLMTTNSAYYRSKLEETGYLSFMPVVNVEPDIFRLYIRSLGTQFTNLLEDNPSFSLCLDFLWISDKYWDLSIKDNLVTFIKHKLKLGPDPNPLSLDDIFRALSSNIFLEDKHLRDLFCTAIQNQMKEIFSSTSFVNISEKALHWILVQHKLGSDLELWKALYKWASARSSNLEELQTEVSPYLHLIHFHKFTLDEFCQYVVPHDILDPEQVEALVRAIAFRKKPVAKHLWQLGTFTNKNKYPTEISFSFALNDISLFKSSTSDFFKFQGLDWQLHVRKMAGTSTHHLAVSLQCFSLSYFECNVKAEFTLFRTEGSSFSRNIEHKFVRNSKENCWIREFISWPKLLNDHEKFIMHNSVILSVCITTLNKK